MTPTRLRSGAITASAVLVVGCGGTTVTDCCMNPVNELPRLAWPVQGVALRDWVINNYVDLDPTGGLRDYRGGAKVYDGHRGTDIDVPNFRWMDEIGRAHV